MIRPLRPANRRLGSTPTDFAARPITKKVNILLVEDHQETRKTLVSLLSRDGHTTMTAETVTEAVGLLGRARIHILLCDRGLPDGDGLDVVVIAKQLNPDIKAIALTARDSDDDHKAGFEAGFDHYLTKPFDFAELRALLAV
jgi:DNA-binding response OmpR family regulator